MGVPSTVNLSLLVEHIDNLPRMYHLCDGQFYFDDEIFDAGVPSNEIFPFLRPDLKFTAIYRDVPESSFSFDITLNALKLLHKINGEDDALSALVDCAFTNKFSLCAEVLKSKNLKLPEDVLHNIIAFIYGTLGDACDTVNSLMTDATLAARARKKVADFKRLTAVRCGFPGCTLRAPLKCSRCRKVFYCSKNHQELHWKCHKRHCRP